MRSLVLAVILLTFVALPLMSQGNRPATMKGVVTRQDGTGIKAAFVLLRDYQSPSEGYVAQKWETRTEADGSFSFVMEPGCYDIFVSATALFLPFSQRICIQDEHSEVFKIKLNPDPHPRLRLARE